ncbi:unnamed protein product [Hyaloperonospora brassicae]|nr:unnamed protein product [Hyaloperonospora brassicae]
MMNPSYSYDSGESSTTNEFPTPCSEKLLSWNGFGDSRYQRPPTIESRRDSAQWSDKRMHELGVAAAAKVNWDDLDVELATAFAASAGDRRKSSVWKPKKSRCSRRSTEMKVFTRLTVRDHRHQTRWGPKGFAVLAETALPCTVQELRLVFRVHSSDIFRDMMQSLYRREFVDGELLRTVELEEEPSGDPARAFDDHELTIKSATFESRRRVFPKQMSWCFLELLQPRDRASDEQAIGRRTAMSTPRLSSPRSGFTRTLVSIARPSIVLDTRRSLHSRSQLLRHVPNVIINYSFEQDSSGHGTRVVFHGEYLPPNAHDAFKRAGHERRQARLWMLRLAASCQRYLLVVRRRRLGMQVIINSTYFSAETASTTALAHCACCYRPFSSCFKRSKQRLCCLCGFVVCNKCAHIQEREHCARGDSRPQIEQVQVCERCLLRVDQARYTAVTEDDLRPAHVIPDECSPVPRPNSTPGGRARHDRSRHTRPNLRTRPTSLNTLLLEILADATAGGPAQQQRKASVLRVMKDIVNEDRTQRRASLAKRRGVSVDASGRGFSLLSGRSRDFLVDEEKSDDDNLVGSVRQLGQIWADAPCHGGDYPLANADSRSYRIKFPENKEEAIVPPIPFNERQRLEIIRGQRLHDFGSVPELDIICSLASRELDCAMSMITVVDKAKLHVLASSNATIAAGQSFPREQSLCAQSILDRNPLVARHVQADVRFSAMSIVRKMGINFYCGFPLLGSDGETVIGSVCCADPQGRNLTRSQYAAMSGLASTASRIVQRIANERTVCA